MIQKKEATYKIQVASFLFLIICVSFREEMQSLPKILESTWQHQ